VGGIIPFIMAPTAAASDKAPEAEKIHPPWILSNSQVCYWFFPKNLFDYLCLQPVESLGRIALVDM